MLRLENTSSAATLVEGGLNETARVKKKLVIVGDGASGKTSLLLVQSGKPFPDDYIPTIFENHSTTVSLPKQTVTLSLWDTAGQEDYDRLRPLSYPDTDVVLLTFAVNNWESFDSIKSRWLPEIKHFLPSTPIMLIATKVDLRYDRNATFHGGIRPVSEEEGRQLASQINAKYYECSAKMGQGVPEVFSSAAKVAVVKNRVKTCKVL